MHSSWLLLAAPAVAVGWFFLNRFPPNPPQARGEGICREERARSGVVSCLGHRCCRPYRFVNWDINQCYGVRYLWFEACWQGSASPES